MSLYCKTIATVGIDKNFIYDKSNKRDVGNIEVNADSIDWKKNEIITAVIENWWLCKEFQYKNNDDDENE